MYFIREPWNFADLVLDGKGNVGMGTADPVAKLHVNGYNYTYYGAYKWLAKGSIGDNPNNENLPASILASHRIIASEFNANSDERIKQDIAASDTLTDLETLNRLRIADFRYRDEIAFGTALQKGLIAQEVERVIPEAVSIHADFVPDIYSISKTAVFEDGVLTVTLDTAHGLKTGHFVRLIAESGNHDVPVVRVTDHVFTVNNWQHPVSSVFVYGKKVADFRTVNYNSIFTMGLGAIQELYRQMQSLKEEVHVTKGLVSARLTPAN
jgi:hypothetical protein